MMGSVGGVPVTERGPYSQPLTPISFLERAGTVHARRIAVVDGLVSYTWSEFRARSRRFANALRTAGLRRGDRVAWLALNSEPLSLQVDALPAGKPDDFTGIVGKLSAREGRNGLVGQAVGARQTHIEREFLLALPTGAWQFSFALQRAPALRLLGVEVGMVSAQAGRRRY